MQVTQTPFNIGDYCQAMDRSEIIVNHIYQRSPKVWPPAARSFLIETILLGYPIPKLSLFQNTDIKTRRTIKEIVDGQQRSVTIHDFYHDRLRISRKGAPTDAAGRKYSELSDELKHKFLSYSLSVDLFIGATKEDIREIFRRINSYTVPLNSEEKRHATYQGEFKWFIYRMTRKFDETFRNIGTFTEKQLNRMNDAKLLSEIVYALLNGISTTKSRELDKLYSDHDKQFDEADQFEANLTEAIDNILQWKPLHGGALMKPYHLYALILALTHRLHPVGSLLKEYQPTDTRIDLDVVLPNLSTLAEAAEDPETESRFNEFVQAGAEKTNVGEQRRKRFLWVSRALESQLL